MSEEQIMQTMEDMIRSLSRTYGAELPTPFHA